MDKPFFRKKRSRDSGLSLDKSEGDNFLKGQGAAGAALFSLEQARQLVPAGLHQQLNRLYNDLLRDTGHASIDDLIILTPDQFKGVIAAALIVGTAHADFQPETAVASEDKIDTITDSDPLTDALEAA